MRDAPLYLDIETSSRADLKKVGASRYSRDPSTIVTVICWAIGAEDVRSAVMPGRALPKEIADHIAMGGIISGWNAGNFELNFLRNYFDVEIKDAQIVDSMQRALHAGLPAGLGDCGDALGLEIQKDAEGHSLMLRMAKPRSVEPLRWWHEEDPERLERLRQYCVRDVEAERAISDVIPHLPPREQEICLLDRKANFHGLRIDVPAARKMLAVAASATARLNEECADITQGACSSPGTAAAKLTAWLGGYAPASLSKDDVAQALKRDDLPDNVRRVLEIRQTAAKSSTKKLNAMLACVDDDDAIRGTIMYYGASRTGRASGRLIQPQNMARPIIKNPNAAIEMIANGMCADGIDALIGDPLDVVSSCLRGMIIPRPGSKFIIYDLAQIEARVVAYLAGQDDIVDVFRRGEDVYSFAAKKLGLPSRQEGKIVTLGLGFGLGKNKFVEFAAGYGVTYSEEEAAHVVAEWRQANQRICQFWWDCDQTIKDAIQTHEKTGKGVELAINKFVSAAVSKARNGKMLLTLRLPCGRRLFYRDVSLDLNKNAFNGKARFEVSYAGTDQRTRKWSRLRSYGGRWVENVVQAVARDCVFEQALAVERAGLGDMVFSVHDELIWEAPEDVAQERFELIGEIMNRAPDWLSECPVSAEGHIASRYGKG